MIRTNEKEPEMFDLSVIGTRHATELSRAQFRTVPTTRRARSRPRPVG
ncbi:MAG: hypothetical protein ACXVFK_08845 [Solirubrobacteraceae bacterium]